MADTKPVIGPSPRRRISTRLPFLATTLPITLAAWTKDGHDMNRIQIRRTPPGDRLPRTSTS
jgi:hypothetical protein